MTLQNAPPTLEDKGKKHFSKVCVHSAVGRTQHAVTQHPPVLPVGFSPYVPFVFQFVALCAYLPCRRLRT